ncbi:hypothetical protein QE152_g28473 [Popillia japonica]|uniref:Uncharacterized protein n=1 Tax=Popillia japonica TaxID=7064 RepID=A0AAW1JJ93_POPJA
MPTALQRKSRKLIRCQLQPLKMERFSRLETIKHYKWKQSMRTQLPLREVEISHLKSSAEVTQSQNRTLSYR